MEILLLNSLMKPYNVRMLKLPTYSGLTLKLLEVWKFCDGFVNKAGSVDGHPASDESASEEMISRSTTTLSNDCDALMLAKHTNKSYNATFLKPPEVTNKLIFTLNKGIEKVWKVGYTTACMLIVPLDINLNLSIQTRKWDRTFKHYVKTGWRWKITKFKTLTKTRLHWKEGGC